MEEKKRRGRRALPQVEKKKKIVVFIKAKNHAKAQREIATITRKYNTEESNTEI